MSKAKPGRTPTEDPPARGLECSACGCRHFEVIYVRPAFGGRIVRRRACRHCGRRISTVERETGT